MFSKKVENHCAAVSLHFLGYNFVRLPQSLSITHARQAELMKKPMTIENIANLVHELIAQKRGSYKKKVNI